MLSQLNNKYNRINSKMILASLVTKFFKITCTKCFSKSCHFLIHVLCCYFTYFDFSLSYLCTNVRGFILNDLTWEQNKLREKTIYGQIISRRRNVG